MIRETPFFQAPNLFTWGLKAVLSDVYKRQAVNFIWPFLMILGAVGSMFGAGGGALIAKTLGEGKHEKAQRLFSMFVYVTAGCGIGIGILGMLLIRPVARLLGAEGIMLENCVIYGRIILSALPLFMLQYEFQTFFITAQKPGLGLDVYKRQSSA